MDSIRTLFDRMERGSASGLPAELARQYGGDLAFRGPFEDRPYVIGNFVSTLDGVVSYLLPGHSGGADISGHDETDRFIMGLLRASADAVMIGSGTFHATAARHLWTAESIHPETADLYRRYRTEVLRKAAAPVTVIVSASGALDLERATFQTAGIPVHIFTTPKGRERLKAARADRLPGTKVTAVGEGELAPGAMLTFLRADGVQLLLHEGGPALFSQFVAAGLVDEFFLTMAPQLAGRSAQHPRPAMIAEAAFAPESAPWLKICSVKQNGSHLYLRYERA